MSVDRRKIETSILDIGETKVLVEDAVKNRKTSILNFSDKNTLNINEIRKLRSLFENKKLFNKIIENAKGSIFVNNILTKEEQAYEDLKNLSIKQVAFLALYFRNQLREPDYFSKIVSDTDGKFDNWFSIYVNYNFLVKLEKFYKETIVDLSNLQENDSMTLYEMDIEKECKKTINFINNNFLEEFKSFLNYDWNKAMKKHEKYIENLKKKKKSMINDIW